VILTHYLPFPSVARFFARASATVAIFADRLRMWRKVFPCCESQSPERHTVNSVRTAHRNHPPNGRNHMTQNQLSWSGQQDSNLRPGVPKSLTHR
jgi:hypothetical protein